jgi:alpha-D-ribose 1-methylphosphonate 5-triphosphate synthase subunit PhnI
MAEIAKLVELYPELQDKDFKLPQEVIDDVRNNGLPLGIAYPHYVNKQKELMIEQLQQAEKNRERNVGSMKSKSTSQGDAFLSGFLSDY